MRSQVRRQWQIQQWLANSRRPLTASEIRDALGLRCHVRTVHRDIEDLASVFNIEKVKTNTRELKWSDTTYSVLGPKDEVKRYEDKKRCTRCKEYKNRELEFWRDWKEPDEKNRLCIECCKVRNKELGKTQYARNYYRDNKARINAQKKQRRQVERKFGVAI